MGIKTVSILAKAKAHLNTKRQEYRANRSMRYLLESDLFADDLRGEGLDFIQTVHIRDARVKKKQTKSKKAKATAKRRTAKV